MEEERSDRDKILFGGVGLGVVGVAAFLVCSLGAVPPLQYGIRYNGFNKYVDIDTVYTPGRHIIGPWSGFLLFPSNVQSIEFTNEARLVDTGRRFPALHTRTKEGLALHLQVSLQYSLMKEYVGKLFSEFNKGYELFFIGVIRETLIRVAAEYHAFELWENRTEVGHQMQKTVDSILSQTYARCWGLQLMVIELPGSFDESIIATQVVNQNITAMNFDQTARVIRAETEVIRAEFDRKVKVIKAGGYANYTLMTKSAKAQARSNTLRTESEVLQTVKDRLKLQDDDLLEYQQYIGVTMLPNASVFFGFEQDSGVMVQQQSAQTHPAFGGERLLGDTEAAQQQAVQERKLAAAAAAAATASMVGRRSSEL